MNDPEKKAPPKSRPEPVKAKDGKNPNSEMYSGTSSNAERAERNAGKSVDSDPSSFPGAEEKQN